MGESSFPLHEKRQRNPDAQCPRATRGDVNLLLKAAWFQGAWIEVGGNNHYKVYPAGGTRMVPIPATPSGYKTVKNMRALLKRSGIDPNTRK